MSALGDSGERPAPDEPLVEPAQVNPNPAVASAAAPTIRHVHVFILIRSIEVILDPPEAVGKATAPPTTPPLVVLKKTKGRK